MLIKYENKIKRVDGFSSLRFMWCILLAI